MHQRQTDPHHGSAKHSRQKRISFVYRNPDDHQICHNGEQSGRRQGAKHERTRKIFFDHNDQKQRNIKYKDKQTDRTSCQIIDQDRNAACPSGCNLVRRRKAVDSNRINKNACQI